jgi:hypothetical protein
MTAPVAPQLGRASSKGSRALGIGDRAPGTACHGLGILRGGPAFRASAAAGASHPSGHVAFDHRSPETSVGLRRTQQSASCRGRHTSACHKAACASRAAPCWAGWGSIRKDSLPTGHESLLGTFGQATTGKAGHPITTPSSASLLASTSAKARRCTSPLSPVAMREQLASATRLIALRSDRPFAFNLAAEGAQADGRRQLVDAAQAMANDTIARLFLDYQSRQAQCGKHVVTVGALRATRMDESGHG